MIQFPGATTHKSQASTSIQPYASLPYQPLQSFLVTAVTSFQTIESATALQTLVERLELIRGKQSPAGCIALDGASNHKSEAASIYTAQSSHKDIPAPCLQGRRYY